MLPRNMNKLVLCVLNVYILLVFPVALGSQLNHKSASIHAYILLRNLPKFLLQIHRRYIKSLDLCIYNSCKS